MCKATLGLELELSSPKAYLYLDTELEEEMIKSKHISIVTSQESGYQSEAKKLFEELFNNGIRVTLDTRTGHDKIIGKFEFTIELVFDHSKFEIEYDKGDIRINNNFQGCIEDFIKFMKEPARDTIFTIEIEGIKGTTFELEIIRLKEKEMIFLSKHMTVPCPLDKLPSEEDVCDKIGALVYILKQLPCINDEFDPTHDPKQTMKVMPRTSLGTIFKRYVSDAEFEEIKSEIIKCHYKKDMKFRITSNCLASDYLEYLERKRKEGDETNEIDPLTTEKCIGVCSLGDKEEKVNNIAYPIFEFRNLVSISSTEISKLKDGIISELKKLYN